MPTTVMCPNGHPLTLGAEFTDVTFGGNGTNVAITCPRCGVAFDAAPGDGVYSTIGGRLVRVAEYLAQADAGQLANLQARLQRLEREQDDRKIVSTLETMGVEPPRGGWFANRDNRMELYTVLGLVLALLGIVLAVRPQHMSTEDVEHWIRVLTRQAP